MVPKAMPPCVQDSAMAKVRSELKSTGYEIFIGILSVLSIVNLVLLIAVTDEALSAVIFAMNALFSAIFLVDFAYRFVTAPSRSDYFLRRFGWADLLASLPFPQFKVLRVFRLVRVVRLLRELGIRNIGRSLVRDPAGSALYVLLLLGIFVLQFGSLLMLHIEKASPDANITTGSDALWYTIETISTVGYGDQYPVTNAGRLMARASSSSVSASSAPSLDISPICSFAPNPAEEEAASPVVGPLPSEASPATLDELREPRSRNPKSRSPK